MLTSTSSKCLLSLVLAAVTNGCATAPPRHSPYLYVAPDSRSALKAERLTEKAEAVASSDPAKAETLLRKALEADLFYAPAHLALGNLLFSQARLYEAAHEYEWARKLDPGSPIPACKLFRTLELAAEEMPD